MKWLPSNECFVGIPHIAGCAKNEYWKINLKSKLYIGQKTGMMGDIFGLGRVMLLLTCSIMSLPRNRQPKMSELPFMQLSEAGLTKVGKHFKV